MFMADCNAAVLERPQSVRGAVVDMFNAGRAAARAEAIEWQSDFDNHDYSYADLAEWGDHFRDLGARYGLTAEFIENGIL